MMNKYHSNEIIKLEGNGQCQCQGCFEKKGWNRIWTSFCFKYKDKIYCSDCMKEIADKNGLKLPIKK